MIGFSDLTRRLNAINFGMSKEEISDWFKNDIITDSNKKFLCIQKDSLIYKGKTLKMYKK